MAWRQRQAMGMGTPSAWERHSIKWEHPVHGNAITSRGNAMALNGNAGLGWGGDWEAEGRHIRGGVGEREPPTYLGGGLGSHWTPLDPTSIKEKPMCASSALLHLLLELFFPMLFILNLRMPKMTQKLGKNTLRQKAV